MVTEPIEGGAAIVAHPEELGGTRHQSAAQFVQDQREAVALVASQDGRFTIFEWSPAEAMVHAHRIEALLQRFEPNVDPESCELFAALEQALSE